MTGTDSPTMVILYMPDEPWHRQRTRYRLNDLLAAVPFLSERAKDIRATIARGDVWSHPGDHQLARLHLIPVGPNEPWDAPRGLTWMPEASTQEAA